MTEVIQGATISLVSQWYDFVGGPATDLSTTPSVSITRLSDGDNTVPATTGGVSHPAAGVYVFQWTPAMDAQLGSYLVVWDGVDGDSQPVQASEVITVAAAGAVDTWCNTVEASSITGQTITQAQLNVAYHVIEVFAGVVTDARARLSSRDHRLLKKAEAYQAAWMAGQVSLMDRSDATLVSQDGLQYSKGDEDMHILGPLAKKSLLKLSWARTRTWDALTPQQALVLRNKVYAETIGVYSNEDEDDFAGEPWRPM